MTKTKATLSIEKEVLEQAKKQIPNISEFFEECLTQYLGYSNGLYPSAEASDLIETISRTQAKLHILNESNKVHENIVKVENERLNRAWRFLWNDYRRRLKINPTLMEEATPILEVDEDTLEDILDFAYVNREELGINFTWEEVYEKYQKEGEE